MKYISYDFDGIVWGIDDTPKGALKDGREQQNMANSNEHLSVAPATDSLISAIERCGSAPDQGVQPKHWKVIAEPTKEALELL